MFIILYVRHTTIFTFLGLEEMTIALFCYYLYVILIHVLDCIHTACVLQTSMKIIVDIFLLLKSRDLLFLPICHWVWRCVSVYFCHNINYSIHGIFISGWPKKCNACLCQLWPKAALRAAHK